MTPSAIGALLALTTFASILAMWRGRRVSSWILIRGALPAWSVASILLKSALAMSLMSSALTPSIGAWVWSAALLVCVAAPVLLLPQRLADLAIWSVSATASSLFWGDVLYYRQFQDFLMINHFVYLRAVEHQGPAAAASLQLRSLIQLQDAAFWLDLPIIFILLWLAPRVAAPKGRTRWVLPVLVAPLFVIGNLVWLSRTTSNLLQNRLYNWSHVQKNGLVAYHVYDVYHWLLPRLSAPRPVADEVIHRRLALSAETIGSNIPHFDAASKANVIVIQLESFQYFLIGLEVDGQEVTPFLNALRRESLYGDALDQTTSGSSSDAMFVMLNSLQPPSGGPFCFLFPTISTRALPRILKERGWDTLHVMSYDGAFWNFRIMGDHFGFERQFFSQDLAAPVQGELVGWGLSDVALFERLIALLKIRQEPYFCYVTTTMMHHPFVELQHHQKLLKLPPKLEKTMAGRYLQLARYRDQALQLFVRRLKEEGLWNKTILVLCGDHRSRLPEREYQRLDVPKLDPVRNRVPLLIHVPDGKVRGQMAGAPGQMDVAPTLLHLLGISDAAPVFLGRNVLAGAHASASAYGYITDGTVGLWRGADPTQARLRQLSDGQELPLTDPRYLWLTQQLDEEVQVSDTLLYGNRILDFSAAKPK